MTPLDTSVPDAAAATSAGAAGPVPRAPRLVFLYDIPTPYMAAVFTELARRIDLSVLFCQASGSRGAWTLDAMPFRHRVVGGFTVRRDDAPDYHLSPRVLRELLRERPDAVICSGFSGPTAYARAYAALTGAKILIHSDGTGDSEARLDPLQQLARRLLVRDGTVVIGNSEPAARRFLELGARPENVFKAPHATDLGPYWAVGEDRRARPDGTRLRIVSVGRLIPRKGNDRLLRAAAEAAVDVPGLVVQFVGTGPLEDDLRRRAAELEVETEFLGFVEPAGMPAVLAQADVFAFPTRSDPFGFVALEAAAAGLPLVSSVHAGATEDLVADGVNGFAVDPDDTAAFAAALVRLGRSSELRERMGREAYEATLGRTPAAAAEGYVAAVRRALEL